MDKNAAVAHLYAHGDDFAALSDAIWGHAETAFTEFASAALLCDFLTAQGFDVQRDAGGIPNAFLASYGTGKPCIGLLAEFDALSGLSQQADALCPTPLTAGGNGHGCGHQLLGVGAVAAAVGVKEYLQQNRLPGRVVLCGCPGEEGGSGKTFMAREGLFDDLDAALTWHPGSVFEVRSGSSLANFQIRYAFDGRSAHAAGAPHLGRSALDAVELMNIGVQFLREHMPSTARVHYAITDPGGISPNVVQAHAEVLYLIRDTQVYSAYDLYKRVSNIARGAALMTDTTLTEDLRKACSNVLPNLALEELLYENAAQATLPTYSEAERAYAAALAHTYADLLPAADAPAPRGDTQAMALYEHRQKVGLNIDDVLLPLVHQETGGGGSTDVGDVSWVCPTAQIYTPTFPLCTPGHSWQMVACGKSSMAHKGMLLAGDVLCRTAIDLLTRPEALAKARTEHAERLQGNPYRCPIPQGVQPRPLK